MGFGLPLGLLSFALLNRTMLVSTVDGPMVELHGFPLPACYDQSGLSLALNTLPSNLALNGFAFLAAACILAASLNERIARAPLWPSLALWAAALTALLAQAPLFFVQDIYGVQDAPPISSVVSSHLSFGLCF